MPLPAKGADKGFGAAAAQSEFMLAVGSMSWQLAVVVLVPVVGGFKLDEYLHTLPLLTITGFVIAMVGMFMVLKRTLDELARRTDATKHKKERLE